MKVLNATTAIRYLKIQAKIPTRIVTPASSTKSEPYSVRLVFVQQESIPVRAVREVL